MMSGEHIPFGLHSNGALVDVTEVNRGHKCDCICPGCGTPLSARQGEKVSWYFAHATGADCVNGYESALHLAVKRIIDETKSLLLPSCVVVARKATDPRQSDALTYQYKEVDPRDGISLDNFDLLHPNDGIGWTTKKKVLFEQIELEQWDENIRPDIVGTVGGKKLFIEVAVTHFVDVDKLHKIQNRRISTIEIDLSEHHRTKWTWAKLREIILESTRDKIWLYNGLAQSRAAQDLHDRIARVMPILEAKAREAELERLKRQAEIDAFLLKAAKRKKYYDEHFAATHDLKIKWSNSLTHHLELCPKNLRLTAWYITSHKQPMLCDFVAKKFNGKFNQRFEQWEFLPSINLLYEIAEFILQNSGCRLTYFKCPLDTRFEEIPTAIRDRIPTS